MFDGPLADILQTSNPELSENSARIRRYLNSYDIINQGSQSQLLKLHKDFARIATHVSQTKKVKIKDIFDEKEFEKLAEKKRVFGTVSQSQESLFQLGL